MDIGIKNTCSLTVSRDNTAIAQGSGTLPVFATPALAALMEKTAMESVAEFLSEGETTVGTFLQAEHISASPVGAKITCESLLTEINGRELTFSVTASDNKGLIGKGIHKRFVVQKEKFMAKASKKLTGEN